MSDECASCGAPIVWALHERTRKAAPYDAEPVVGGAWRIEAIDGLLVARHDLDSTEPGHMPHFATCPHADQWRRRR